MQGAQPERRRPGRDDGLSLAEMIVAIAVVMVVLTAALAAIITAQQSQRVAESTDRATQIAFDQVEAIRNLGFSRIGFYANTYSTASTASPSGTPSYEARPNSAGVGTYRPCASPCQTEPVVVLGPTDPTTTADQKILPVLASRTIPNGNGARFIVHTYITYARGNSTTTNPQASISTGNYTFKRIRVVVYWKNGSTTRSVVNETLVAPNAAEEVPPGIPVTP